MNNELHHQQRQMLRYLLANFLLVLILPFFFTLYGGLWDYLLTAVVAALLLALINRNYGLYLFWSFAFIIYLLKEIVVGNIAMAWLILQPKPKLDPGIIAIPLTVSTSLEITVLSLAIAATPGTLVIDLDRDPAGGNTLYIHTLNVGNPDQFRASIKNGFERMILYISRGVTP
jgi:multicomponent Na+:H+ antiporter subunit E